MAMPATQPMGMYSAVLNIEDGSQSKIMRDHLGGCNSCPFINSDECPHGLKVGERHAQGLCSKFTQFAKMVIGEHYVGLTKQKQYMELAKDQMIVERLRRQTMTSTDIHPDLLDWTKHTHDVMAKIRKQEEGSKINIKRAPTPSEVIDAIRRADKQIDDEKIVDAEVVEYVDEESDDRDNKQ